MKRFSLRLPDDLHTVLQRSAQKEYRSLHNQILIVLEDFVRQSEFRDLEAILEPTRDLWQKRKPAPDHGWGQ